MVLSLVAMAKATMNLTNGVISKASSIFAQAFTSQPLLARLEDCSIPWSMSFPTAIMTLNTFDGGTTAIDRIEACMG